MARGGRSAKRKVSAECILWIVLILSGTFITYVNIFVLQSWDAAEENAISSSVDGMMPIKPQEEAKAAIIKSHNESRSIETQSISEEETIQTKQVDLTNPKAPLIQNLIDSGMTQEKAMELSDRLPNYQQVVDRFGKEPRIVGLETCRRYRDSVPYRARLFGPAGPFNSGTNLLHNLLKKNCHIPGSHFIKQKGVLWQVNWGKHQPARTRFDNYVHTEIKNNSVILPIVMVRDPYSWMQSMCKVRYSAHWYHIVPDHCPNFIPNHVEYEWFNRSMQFIRRHYKNDPWKVDNAWNKAHFNLDSKVIPLWVRYKTLNTNHTSLVHMWKDWYQEYYEVDFPRIMVRLEDLVYHPRLVLTEICGCVGGKLEEELTLAEESAKSGERVHGTNRTGLVDAMVKHVHGNRTQGMTFEDAAFARTVLDESLMHVFGYEHPS